VTTAEESMNLANLAYRVDPLKQHPPITAGQMLDIHTGNHSQEYWVLDTANNPVNGFQAMAVAPIVDGAPDLSRITISYAGTNPDHRADLLADMESVVDDQQGVGTQVDDARAFADRVRDAHQGASVSTGGHSLGAYLAMVVAAENRWSATTFNGPDAYNALSPEARVWLEQERAAGRRPLTNYVNAWDLIGNLYENRTGAAIYVEDEKGRSVLDYHNIGTGEDVAFRFTSDGSIVGAGATGRPLERIIENATKLPGLADALGPSLTGLVGSLRNPTFMRAVGKNVSGLVVAVNTASALGLAASVGSAVVSLEAIKRTNANLVDRMQTGLDTAKSAALQLPYITVYDIERCVDVEGLSVHQNIDERAVEEVDQLVDDHIALVTRISDGVTRSVEHSIAQDAQWALTYGGR
jgi:hypothetical protein